MVISNLAKGAGTACGHHTTTAIRWQESAKRMPLGSSSLLDGLLHTTTNATGVAELGRCPGTDRWGRWPSPVGLTLGILAALCAQILVIAYHYARLRWCATRRVQGARPYEFWEGIKSHLANPGGIVMMVAYLCASWMFDVMPCSYYHFDGGVRCIREYASKVAQTIL